MKKSKAPAPRERHDRNTVLARILATPHLEHAVPQLQPDLIHRVIQSCGLEDCGDLVVLATPEQLTRIFDLDLWRSPQPGMDEEFDAERFGVWLEVLAELGPSIAAQKLAHMDADLVVTGLALHARVFDGAVVTPCRTTDGTEVTGIFELDHGLDCNVGGYRIVAKRTDSWDAIVSILISLDTEHPDYFHQLMSGCRALSNSSPEPDVHNLLEADDQMLFNLAGDRERRREQQGYVTPAQARAFLQMSRELQLGSDAMPLPNPVAHAYFRTIKETETAHTAGLHSNTTKSLDPSVDPVEAADAVVDVLLEAGIIAEQPRALLTAAQDHTESLARIRNLMQFVFDRDQMAHTRRSEELSFVANAIMTGCSVQNRPFTADEAREAAVAVCNLGLENWPPQWSSAKSCPTTFS